MLDCDHIVDYSVEVPGGRGENPYQNAAFALAKVRAVFSKWDQEDARAKTPDKPVEWLIFSSNYIIKGLQMKRLITCKSISLCLGIIALGMLIKKGSISLQDHGAVVWYRNIKIKRL